MSIRFSHVVSVLSRLQRFLCCMLSLLGLLVMDNTHAEAENCAGCHREEVAQWQHSQHAKAMLPVSPTSVLGDFDQGYFEAPGIKAEFYRAADQYRVKLEEAGQTRDWEVRYSFGVYPLQQYLLVADKGHLQALNIAWDSRSKAQGGQRWFLLSDPQNQQPGQALHWQGVYQNWNAMCADCHSTAVEERYTPEDDHFATTYAEINVSCSACHSNARSHALSQSQAVQAKATDIQLRVPAGADLTPRGGWLPGSDTHKPQHIGEASSSEQLAVCGRCHSLRTKLQSQSLMPVSEQYRISRLQEPLYFADGRVREEVFVLGSFLQSKMHQAGVVCSNCHNPHSGKPRITGNGLCAQCHDAAVFDRSEHHQHPVNSDGAQCVACHMPQRRYMKIDLRREHNFTTPNPHTAALADSPDPCQACHSERGRDWSISQVERLWPGHVERADWFKVQQAGPDAVATFITDQDQAALYRASLLEARAPMLAALKPQQVTEQSQNSDPLLRESAWKAAQYLPEVTLRQLSAEGLQDQHLAVRLAAYETLLWRGLLPESAVTASVDNEYRAYLNLQAFLPVGRTLLARYQLAKGNTAKAEQALQVALRKDAAYLPAQLLLVDLLRAQQRYDQALQQLNEALVVSPGRAELLHLQGLTLLQLKQLPQARAALKAATDAAPDNADFSYRYALVLYHSLPAHEALPVVQTLRQRFPEDARFQQLVLKLHH